jgi:pimeloyl-ACP methyl ester carboxylesterase
MKISDFARHGVAPINPELRLHYVTAGDSGPTVVLLHGFPQTWWEWHRVIPRLVEAGIRVVAPDYRGAGESSRPLGGYDKRTMANDIRQLVREHLRIENKVVLVGHDIGLMVAYAYAQSFRDEVSHLVIADAPLPGTSAFDLVKSNPRVWHFAFHNARDIAEMLVAGRELQYLQAFFAARCFDPRSISNATLSRTPRQEQCELVLSCTAHSSGTERTIARHFSATGNLLSRSSQHGARSVIPDRCLRT